MYVPKTGSGIMMPLLLGGDQLSVERGESAQTARMDSVTPDDRLEEFLWKSEDWHGHTCIISLQVSSFIVLSSRCMEEIENCFMCTMCLTSHVVTNTNVIIGFL
jgi:hypothetical protein